MLSELYLQSQKFKVTVISLTVKVWILIAGKLQILNPFRLLGSVPLGIITLNSGGR